uniref:Uncharacterized protein n=1 Tax=Arundo donax TaxID=35708 RepID=A0A0A9H4C1_ARUDO
MWVLFHFHHTAMPPKLDGYTHLSTLPSTMHLCA